MQQKKILVTGGTGYIGSHTVVELLQAGHEVTIADNLSNSEASVVDRIEQITGLRPGFVKVDLAHQNEAHQFYKTQQRVDAVIHFAASKAVGESVEQPLMYYHNNLNSLIHLLEYTKEYNIGSLVFSSSCTVYGQPSTLPVTEETARREAESPYGNTKRIGEDILRDFIRANRHLNGIALRYFNPIGAHPSALIGELPRGVPGNLLPFVTQTAAGIRKELQIFGSDYNTPDGTAIRDYIDVVDLAKAHMVAIQRLLERKNQSGFEIFNLGTGKGVSVLEMVKTFEEVTQQKVNYRITDRRPGDIEQIWADTSLANEILGWKAERALEETLLAAWNWEKRLRKIS